MAQGSSGSDTFGAYLRDVGRYKLLTPEEEKELTTRYVRDREPEDGRTLVTANLRLVVKVARDYHATRVPMIDLVQEGNLGLLHAVEKFDPEKGVRFASYAVWWIKAYILRHLVANHSLVKMGTTRAQRKLFYNLRKEQSRLEKQGIKATNKLIAANLEVETAEVELMRGRLAGGHEVSFEAPVGGGADGEGRVLADVLEDGAGNAEEWAVRAEIRTQLFRSLNEFGETLDARQFRIWELRSRADDPLPLRALGEELGISAERCRQIEARMLRRLRRHLDKAFPGLDLSSMVTG
jgi:RNA polymerase sigma-32 factor